VKPTIKLADILNKFGEEYETKFQPNPYIKKHLHALRICRTSAMTGHIDQCSHTDCGHMHVSYNSCRNRHCPSCQNTQKEQWLQTMRHRTLPVPYFHVVFTIPHEFNGLCIKYPKLMYDLLFKVSWATIKGFASSEQYGIKTGMTAILHTWGDTALRQQMSLHPHLHCILPAGGMTKNGNWKTLKSNKAKGRKGFLFPMPALKKIFKAKFMAGLRKLIRKGIVKTQEPLPLQKIYQKEWTLYAKRPFGGAEQVIEYLGRYTHKVAISNYRLIGYQKGQVIFQYKDYADGGKTKQMKLLASEFIRRFTLHILPKGFTKIRHFGLHAGASHKQMDQLYKQLYYKDRPPLVRKSWQKIAQESNCQSFDICPKCQNKSMKTKAIWNPGREPPSILKTLFLKQK
jgi:hypothetical protein